MKMFGVEEGDTAEIVLQKNVKGTSRFNNLDLLLLGTITSEGVTAGEGDCKNTYI